MAEPVRARRLTDQEGRRLLQIVRRGKHGSVIVTAARTRPEKPVQPFTHWSLRKLAGYLAGLGRPVRIGRERLRQVLHERGISFQRTRTWKESTDPDRDAKLDRIQYVTSACPDRCFASGQFGPLS
ncbi:MAG TPA: IS630 family transposase, partial [Streptosporangiaceae bacterium]